MGSALAFVPADDAQASSPKSPKKQRTYAIFGLGNMGDEYKGTRHNIGRDIVLKLAEASGTLLNKSGYSCSWTEIELGNHNVALATPETFMNLSGRGVRALTTALKVPHKQVFVLYDDVDLPLGTLRIKNKGSAGGQKGAADTIKCMGADSKFVRVRIGVGRPMQQSMPKFVLGRFGHDEKPLLEKTIRRVIGAVQYAMDHGLEKAMTKYNRTAEQFEQDEKEALLKKDDKYLEARREEGRKRALEAAERWAAAKRLKESPGEQKFPLYDKYEDIPKHVLKARQEAGEAERIRASAVDRVETSSQGKDEGSAVEGGTRQADEAKEERTTVPGPSASS